MVNELLAADERFTEAFLLQNTVSLALDVSYNRFQRSINSLGLNTGLSRSEAQLLEVLLSCVNKKVDDDKLIKILHPNEIAVFPYDKETLWVSVTKLRKKLSLYPSIEAALTTEEEGYSWQDPLKREEDFSLPAQKQITTEGLFYDFFYRGIMTEDEKIRQLAGYKLLEPLIAFPNTIINYETLTKLVWGQYATYYDYKDRNGFNALKIRLYNNLERVRPGLSSNIGMVKEKGLMWLQ